MSTDSTVITAAPFGPDKLIKQLGLRTSGERVLQAVRTLWNAFINDEELWQRNNATDRVEVEETLHYHIKPILTHISTFAPTFPKPLENIEDLTIAAIVDSHIYAEDFSDQSLTRTYHGAAQCLHEGDDSEHTDEYPHSFPLALTIFSQAQEADTRARKNTEGMLPEAHYLYLVWHLNETQQCIEELQDQSLPYEARRELADKLTPIEPAFLIDGDPLSNNIKAAEEDVQRLRPKKATLSLAGAQTDQPTI